jgi:hypothetical protein
LCRRSADCSCPLLDFSLGSGFQFCGQLKNRSLLTFAQERQKHDLAIRKFERIVMGGYPVLVDLPKDRCQDDFRQEPVAFETASLRFIFQPGLDIDAVGPEIHVVLDREVAFEPAGMTAVMKRRGWNLLTSGCQDCRPL